MREGIITEYIKKLKEKKVRKREKKEEEETELDNETDISKKLFDDEIKRAWRYVVF